MTPMTATRAALFGISVLLCSVAWTSRSTRAQAKQDRVVRLAELEIDPPQLERYKAILREEIKASIAHEPGVLTLYAVSVKDRPSQIRLFEVYANSTAYQLHLQTPHFLRYKAETQGMVLSLTLLDADPVLLGSKPVAN